MRYVVQVTISAEAVVEAESESEARDMAQDRAWSGDVDVFGVDVDLLEEDAIEDKDEP